MRLAGTIENLQFDCCTPRLARIEKCLIANVVKAFVRKAPVCFKDSIFLLTQGLQAQV